jgi:hypothetical protein
MTKSIIPRDNIIYDITRAAGTSDFLEIPQEDYRHLVTQANARLVLKEVVYTLMYKSITEKGLPHDEVETHEVVTRDFQWLIDKTGRKTFTINSVASLAEERSKEKWVESFDNRSKIAAEKYRDRMIDVSRLMPLIVRAVAKGDLGAVDKFVSMARFEMEAAGYRAPTKYEFSASSEQEITEQDKLAAAEVMAAMKDFEEGLLGDGSGGSILDGHYESIDEEE